MQIAANKVVSFYYSLSDAQGAALESPYSSEPTAYLHGHDDLLSALEEALLGKIAGEKISITLTPEQAYGERHEDAIQRIPIKHLQGDSARKNKLKVGATVTVNTADGPWQATVLKVGKFNVDIDNNHPLAGKTLTFDIEIINVRDAAEDELAHGHAHSTGGHQHD